MEKIPTLRVQTNGLPVKKEIEPLQGRVRASRSNNLPPMSTTADDNYNAPREVFLAVNTNEEGPYESLFARPLMICWRLEHTESSFCVIELTDAQDYWVYWGACIKDLDLSCYEAVVLGTLSLEARKALSSKANEVEVEVRDKDASYRGRWILRLIDKAVEGRLIDSNRARRAITYIRALDFSAVGS